MQDMSQASGVPGGTQPGQRGQSSARLRCCGGQAAPHPRDSPAPPGAALLPNLHCWVSNTVEPGAPTQPHQALQLRAAICTSRTRPTPRPFQGGGPGVQPSQAPSHPGSSTGNGRQCPRPDPLLQKGFYTAQTHAALLMHCPGPAAPRHPQPHTPRCPMAQAGQGRWRVLHREGPGGRQLTAGPGHPAAPGTPAHQGRAGAGPRGTHSSQGAAGGKGGQSQPAPRPRPPRVLPCRPLSHGGSGPPVPPVHIAARSQPNIRPQ